MESDLNLPSRYAFGVEILKAIFAIGSRYWIFGLSPQRKIFSEKLEMLRL
jgi:hypothetical protein